MKKIIIVLLTLYSITSYSQWTYSSSKSDFDGSYKTSSIYGSGGKFPYTKPLLVVNKFKNSSVRQIMRVVVLIRILGFCLHLIILKIFM